MKRFTKWSTALAMAFVTANVQAIPLQDLIGGDTIQSGDKLFADWGLVQPLLDPIDLTAIEVTAVGDGSAGNEYGLLFSGNGELNIFGFDFLDLFFGFSVAVLDPGMLVNSAFMTGNVNSMGDHLITVEKDVLDAAGNALAFMDIFSDELFGVLDSDLDNSVGFAAASKIWIQDNIFVSADIDGFAELTEFTQRFGQINVTTVPTPGTVALFALGLMGLANSRRKQPQ